MWLPIFVWAGNTWCCKTTVKKEILVCRRKITDRRLPVIVIPEKFWEWKSHADKQYNNRTTVRQNHYAVLHRNALSLLWNITATVFLPETVHEDLARNFTLHMALGHLPFLYFKLTFLSDGCLRHGRQMFLCASTPNAQRKNL